MGFESNQTVMIRDKEKEVKCQHKETVGRRKMTDISDLRNELDNLLGACWYGNALNNHINSVKKYINNNEKDDQSSCSFNCLSNDKIRKKFETAQRCFIVSKILHDWSSTKVLLNGQDLSGQYLLNQIARIAIREFMRFKEAWENDIEESPEEFIQRFVSKL